MWAEKLTILERTLAITPRKWLFLKVNGHVRAQMQRVGAREISRRSGNYPCALCGNHCSSDVVGGQFVGKTSRNSAGKRVRNMQIVREDPVLSDVRPDRLIVVRERRLMLRGR